MISMHMGVEYLHQLEIKLVKKLHIPVNPVENTIDKQRLAAFSARQKIRVGTSLLVK